MNPRTMDEQWNLFSLKSRTFGLGQTNWANKIWGIFGRTINTHFGPASPLTMFFIIQPLFLQKTKHLYPHSKHLFGIGIWIWIWAAKNKGFSLRVSVIREWIPQTYEKDLRHVSHIYSNTSTSSLNPRIHTF
jgi:hypothetical protein